MLHISLTYPAGRMVELDTYVYNNAETEGLKHLAAIFKDAFVVSFSF